MKKILLILPIVIAACAPTTQFPDVNKDLAEREANIQREIALREDHKYFTRLQDTAAPIFMANADICPKDKVKPFYGLHVSSLDTLDDDFKDAAQIVHGLQQQTTVFYVSPKTPASGKIKEGDLIKQVDGEEIKSGKYGVKKLDEYLLDKDRLGQETKFIIERDAKPYTVLVRPVAACGGIAVLSEGTERNAYADGEHIIFTKPMLDMTKTDSELALVIGHEIAHNSRLHNEAGAGNMVIGMVLGAAVSVATGVNVMGIGSDLGRAAFSQSFEAEADYVGLYHVARAGYPIDEAPYLWRRMAAASPSSIDMVGQSHPSSAHRFVALEQTVKEIQEKKAKGLPLVPEEQKAEDVKKKVSEYN